MAYQINLLGYITIKGVIRCITGIHVGGSSDSIDKGGIDSPVIKNPVTNQPYIPGSSLRGRMRCILEKATGKHLDKLVSGIYIHKGEQHNEGESCEICRSFGTTHKKVTIPSPLIVRDSLLTKRAQNEYMDGRLPVTEVKTETAIDRITSAAHPRVIERVPAGAEFSFEFTYRVQSNGNGSFTTQSNQEVRDDINNILWALEIIEKHDGLGGHSARGYGQVKFVITGMESKKVDLTTNAFSGGSHGFQYTLTHKEDEATDYDTIKKNFVSKIEFPEHSALKEESPAE